MAKLEFTKATDSEHEIKLDSKLIFATWSSPLACGGQEAEIEVGTALVGNGAKIEIRGKSENGKSLGTVKGTVNANKFKAKLTIPDDIEFGDKVYYEVKLSKNSINGESDHIAARPAVSATNLEWGKEEARRGDVVPIKADIAGMLAGEEVTVIIYEADQDGAHDRIAEIPTPVSNDKIELRWEYEYHEDTDEIPTEDEMQEYGRNYNPPEYFFVVKIGDVSFGREQESGLLKFKDWIEIEGFDAYGEPAANADYKVTLPDGEEKEGKLDAEGKARVEGVPPGSCQVEIIPEEDDSSEDSVQSDSGSSG